MEPHYEILNRKDYPQAKNRKPFKNHKSSLKDKNSWTSSARNRLLDFLRHCNEQDRRKEKEPDKKLSTCEFAHSNDRRLLFSGDGATQARVLPKPTLESRRAYSSGSVLESLSKSSQLSTATVSSDFGSRKESTSPPIQAGISWLKKKDDKDGGSTMTNFDKLPKLSVHSRQRKTFLHGQTRIGYRNYNAKSFKLSELSMTDSTTAKSSSKIGNFFQAKSETSLIEPLPDMLKGKSMINFKEPLSDINTSMQQTDENMATEKVDNRDSVIFQNADVDCQKVTKVVSLEVTRGKSMLGAPTEFPKLIGYSLTHRITPPKSSLSDTDTAPAEPKVAERTRSEKDKTQKVTDNNVVADTSSSMCDNIEDNLMIQRYLNRIPKESIKQSEETDRKRSKPTALSATSSQEMPVKGTTGAYKNTVLPAASSSASHDLATRRIHGTGALKHPEDVISRHSSSKHSIASESPTRPTAQSQCTVVEEEVEPLEEKPEPEVIELPVTNQGSSSFQPINERYDTMFWSVKKGQRAMYDQDHYVTFQHSRFSKEVPAPAKQQPKLYDEKTRMSFIKVKVADHFINQ